MGDWEVRREDKSDCVSEEIEDVEDSEKDPVESLGRKWVMVARELDTASPRGLTILNGSPRSAA